VNKQKLGHCASGAGQQESGSRRQPDDVALDPSDDRVRCLTPYVD
jgi:hypothetical protein